LSERISIREDSKYGVIVECKDSEDADILDDILSEMGNVEFSVRFSEEIVEFFISNLAVIDVRMVVDKIVSKNGAVHI